MTTQTLKTVRLYGKLGAQFGRTHRIAVGSPAEAVRFLCAILPGFEAFLTQAKDNGFGFGVLAGKRHLGQEDLTAPVGDADIRIAPVTLGAKNQGVFQVILGVVLIVVGVLIQVYVTDGAPNPISNYLYGMGASMILGGIIQLLSPHPKTPGQGDKPDNKPNYNFSGVVNTEAQGHPIPVVYGGPKKVGSAVFSAGIQVDEAVYVNTLSLPGGSHPTGLGGHGLTN